MIKKVLGILAIATVLVSCGTQQKKEKECTEKEQTAITVDNLLADITNYIDKDIVVAGTVNHVCSHGGKRMFIMGEDPDIAIKIIPNDEVCVFEKELEGSRVMITGIVKELRIDEAYVANLEKELSEGTDNEAMHDHSGEGEEDHSEAEVDSSKNKQIEHMKIQIAESEKGYYSQFWVEASKFEVKKCDHEHAEENELQEHKGCEGNDQEHAEGEEHTH